MVTKVYIKDNTKSPLHYLPDLANFANSTEYIFKPGVNIIVGENGCGKTTLLNLIKKYLLVDFNECDKGAYNSNINSLYKGIGFLDGVDVYADYTKNTYRFCHPNEKSGDESLKDFASFGELFKSKTSSTGEGVITALDYLFSGVMFNKDARLTFDYTQFDKLYHEYLNYVNTHRVECPDEYTILMDEPDRNLSLENIMTIKNILSFHKEQTQIICVIHNPLLIYALSGKRHINWIELTEGYMDSIIYNIKQLVKEN